MDGAGPRISFQLCVSSASAAAEAELLTGDVLFLLTLRATGRPRLAGLPGLPLSSMSPVAGVSESAPTLDCDEKRSSDVCIHYTTIIRKCS